MQAEGVSIVIPCFNGAATIGRQLGALADQTWDGDWEVIVADNGSTDGLAQAVAEWADRVPGLRVVDASRRRGASAARNEGVRHARHDMIIWIDADDIVNPGWLQAMGEAAQRHSLFSGGHGIPTSDARELRVGRTAPTVMAGILADRGFLDAAPSNNLGCARAVFDAVGGFDESMAAVEDTAFCWAAQLLGHTLVWVPEATIDVYARTNLKGLTRQQYTWGFGAAELYAKFRREGMPRSNVIGALVRWGILVVTSPLALFSRTHRYRWSGVAARRWGRLAGSVRFRVFYP